MTFFRVVPAVVASLVLAACASAGPHVREAPPEAFVGWFHNYATCRQEYAAADARVAAAGVADATYYRIPGYPYLRTDRTLASFAGELTTPDLQGGFVRRMRELDQEAREFEYLNLGLGTQEAAILRFRLLECGRVLAGIELEDPAQFADMLKTVKPPDGYAKKGWFGGPDKTQIKAKLQEQQAAAMADLSAKANTLKSDAPLQLWTVKVTADQALLTGAFERALPDEFGIPGLVDSQWLALAETNAPRLLVETAGDGDRLGTPRLTDAGASVDLGHPVVHYWVTFARFGGAAVPQLNYFVWFPLQGKESVDSFIWRVTLDAEGHPLAYESLHASGRDHRWFPVQEMTRRTQDVPEEAPVVAPELAPSHDATILVRTGTHDVRRVIAPGDLAPVEEHEYEIGRYEDLLSLPRPSGGARSLFGSDGLLAGATTPDPLGEAAGFVAPGTLRQYGHHAIAHLGRESFDDPYLMSEVFQPPATMAKPAGAAGAAGAAGQ